LCTAFSSHRSIVNYANRFCVAWFDCEEKRRMIQSVSKKRRRRIRPLVARRNANYY
jgi:hypothetical protein